ncbi:T9SS type A sorting domain-containing protein [bacterium]|nr:MAG: T9SS type A sorting domain-containing protein [bacterium]
MIFFYFNDPMLYRSPYIFPFLVVILLIFAGFVVYSFSNGKSNTLLKTSLSVVTRSTGVASVFYEDGKAAEFVGHHFNGLKYPNALYQGFIVIHFDEMDSVLTKHSAVGRTNARNNPGDKNGFKWLQSHLFENSQTSIDTSYFTIDEVSTRFTVRQIIEAKKDSSHAIFVTYIFEFIKPPGDTAIFSNTKLLFGYDGDIGNSLGGFSDDSSGYYEDDSSAVVYVFDDSLKLYSGVGLINKKTNAVAGNYALMHQSANRAGSNKKDLDTLLFNLMSQPVFVSSLPKTDISVFWAIDLGTILPIDTTRDTIQFVLLNGSAKNTLIQAAKGKNAIENKADIYSIRRIPSSIFLYSNYPNPFNPETTIKYDLDRETVVSLKIYNLLGQEVRHLFHGKQGAGQQKVVWDGRDERGNELASGIYIYRLDAGKVSKTKKMILVK